MNATGKASGVDGPLFKRALLGSLNWLASNHEEVNRLNVFPVPDGDTGTNMLLTLQSAVEDVKQSNAAEVSKIAKLASHGSLMGARGNSGVILSQIFRGFARAVEGKSALSPAELAAAFEEAANAAYRAVNKPTEGTILTVAREAGRAAAAAASSPDANVPRVIAAAAAGARAAVLKTPSQLQILRDAGVVDAGGFGLQLILEGMLKKLLSIRISRNGGSQMHTTASLSTRCLSRRAKLGHEAEPSNQILNENGNRVSRLRRGRVTVAHVQPGRPGEANQRTDVEAW